MIFDIYFIFDFVFYSFPQVWKTFWGIVTVMLDCDIVVSDFKLQSRNNVHFRTKRRIMNSPIHPAMS